LRSQESYNLVQNYRTLKFSVKYKIFCLLAKIFSLVAMKGFLFLFALSNALLLCLGGGVAEGLGGVYHAWR
jgi:hypothetical protein